MTDHCPRCHGDGIDPACDGRDEFDHYACTACDGTGRPPTTEPIRPERLAEIERVTPRRITDINEIEALPIGSILLEHIPVHPGHAMAWRKEIDGWWYPSTFSWVRQRGALAMAGARPLLIHAPGATTGDTR